MLAVMGPRARASLRGHAAPLDKSISVGAVREMRRRSKLLASRRTIGRARFALYVPTDPRPSI